MCDRVLRLMVAAFLAAAPARAQQRGDVRARIAYLERELKSAEAAAARADSAARSRGGAELDTASAGALRVLSPNPIRAQARAGAADAWRLIDGTFGTAAATLAVQPFTLVLMRREGGGQPPAGVVNGVLTTGSASDISQRLIWAAATAIAARNDSGLAHWLQGALVPEREPERERRGVYVAFVTAPSPAVGRCYEGDLAGCRSSLGLVPGTPAIEEWYDAPRRRTLAQELENLDQVRSAPRLRAACATDLSDSACLGLLRLVPPDAVPPPLPSAARFDVLRTALELGGRGAYARLLGTARFPIEARLAAASGVSADSLLRAWHAAVFAARPQPVTVGPRAAWAALAWGVAFGLLALRSTRWR